MATVQLSSLQGPMLTLQPLKEVSQEPAAVSDGAIKDKFEELDKAGSEQLVDFLMVSKRLGSHTRSDRLHQQLQVLS